jgi:hypothetical protein
MERQFIFKKFDLAQSQVTLSAADVVRFGSQAGMTLLNFDVRITPESRHSPTRSGCLLWAETRPSASQQNSNYSITLSHSYCTGLGPTKNLVDNLGGASKLVRNVRSIRYHAIGSKADITLT